MASYNSLPPEVVARAVEWLGIKALGRLSPCDQASNRLASTAFEALAKRRFTSLSLLASSGPKDWRELLRRHLCFAFRTHAQRTQKWYAKDFTFVFEWFDGDPATEGTKSLGSAPAGISNRRGDEEFTVSMRQGDVLDSGPPAYVQCYVQKRGHEDRCALLYRGGIRNVADTIIIYESASPWLSNSWTDFPPADRVTMMVYRKEQKDFFLIFLIDGADETVSASEVCTCLDHHLAYH